MDKPIASVARSAPSPVRQPKISVCLPTYNRAHFLGETIRSILAQSLADFELIVSDNASTDDTGRVVASFDDPRIRPVRHERTMDHYQNMNVAIAMAQGQYVCLIHDDDIYAPDFLARESELLDAHPSVGMVHCAVRLVDRDRHLLGLHRVSPQTRIAPGLQEFERYLGGHDVCCSTVMCRREIWADAGPFDHTLMCGDWLMWLNIALRADIGYVATPLADIRVHGSSITSAMNPMRWYDEFLEVTRRAMNQLRERHLSLARAPEDVVRIGSGRQSRRFLMAALAAAAEGADDQALAYVRVLRRLRQRGASPLYSWIGAVLVHKGARPVIRPLRAMRRALMRLRLPSR